MESVYSTPHGETTDSYSAVDLADKKSNDIYQRETNESVPVVLELSLKLVKASEREPDSAEGPKSASASKPPAAVIPSAVSAAKQQKYLKVLNSAPSRYEDQVNWNEEFQTLLARRTSTAAERLDRAAAIRSLSLRFIRLANEIGKVIIDEFSLPDEAKTIKPRQDKSGVAGGSKYIHANIFFKFPNDTQNLYGGYEFAMKSAGHEARGIKMYLNAEVPGLHVPLMTCIDYRGRRLIAASEIPISGTESLIYGSDNGAVTVHAVSKEFNELMKMAGQKLNLKGHMVGGKLLYGPGDIEGHRGSDRRFYVVDTSRVCPPEPLWPHAVAVLIPANDQASLSVLELQRRTIHSEVYTALSDEPITSTTMPPASFRTVSLPFEGHLWPSPKPAGQKNARASAFANRDIVGDAIYVLNFRGFHLYQQLRPERVRASAVPLSSDAYSAFVLGPDQQIHNAEVKAETDKLLQQIIPKFALELDTRVVIPLHVFDLARTMHERGINNRMLGWLRCNLIDPFLRSLTLMAMTIRVVKSILRAQLRQSRSDDEVSAKKMISSFFNLLLGTSSASELFWCSTVKIHLMAKFDLYGSSLSDSEVSPRTNLRSSLSVQNLFQALQIAVGVRFHEETVDRSQLQPQQFFGSVAPFAPEDIKEITSKVRPIHSDAAIIELLRENLLGDVEHSALHKNLSHQTLRRFHTQIKRIFGVASLQHAQSWLALAKSSLENGEMDLALKYCEKAKFVFQHVAAPVVLQMAKDLGVMSAYIIANVYFQLKYYTQARQVLESCIKILELFGSSGHVYYILSLNLLVECMLAIGDTTGVKEVAEKFFAAWRNRNPFLGNASLRKQLFLREVPIALSVCVQELNRAVDDLLMNEDESNPKVAAWLGVTQGTVPMELSITAPGLRVNMANAFEGRTAAQAAQQRSEELALLTRTRKSNDKTGFFVMGHVLDGGQYAVKRGIPLLMNPFGARLVVSVKGNSRVMYALTEDGSVYSWGQGIPALGQGDTIARSQPTQIKSLCNRRVIDIACNSADYCEFALLLTAQGDVYSVGSGVYGRLGHGDRNSRSTPRLITALRTERIAHIAVGTHHCIALNTRGELFCWGSNAYGQCASRLAATVLTPQKVTGIPAAAGAIRLATTYRSQTVVQTASGAMYHWGLNTLAITMIPLAQKIVNAKTRHFIAVPKLLTFPGIASLPRITSITLGTRHMLLLDVNSQVWSAGLNDLGQLGYGDQLVHTGVRQIDALANVQVRQISAAENYSVAVTDTGEVYHWGATVDGVIRPVPVRLLHQLQERRIAVVCAQKKMIAACCTSVAVEMPSVAEEKHPVPLPRVSLVTHAPSTDRLVELKCELPHYPDGDVVSIRSASTSAIVLNQYLPSMNSYELTLKFYLNAPPGSYVVSYATLAALERQTDVCEFKAQSGADYPMQSLGQLKLMAAHAGHASFFSSSASSSVIDKIFRTPPTQKGFVIPHPVDVFPSFDPPLGVYLDDAALLTILKTCKFQSLPAYFQKLGLQKRLCERDSSTGKYFLEFAIELHGLHPEFWKLFTADETLPIVLNDVNLESKRYLQLLFDKLQAGVPLVSPGASESKTANNTPIDPAAVSVTIQLAMLCGWLPNLRNADVEPLSHMAIKSPSQFAAIDEALKHNLDLSLWTAHAVDEDLLMEATGESTSAAGALALGPQRANSNAPPGMGVPATDVTRAVQEILAAKFPSTVNRAKSFLSNCSFCEHPRALAILLSSITSNGRASPDVVLMLAERVQDLTATALHHYRDSIIQSFLAKPAFSDALVLLLKRGLPIEHPLISVAPLQAVVSRLRSTRMSDEEQKSLFDIAQALLEAGADPCRTIGSATKSPWAYLQEAPDCEDFKNLFSKYVRNNNGT